MSEDRKIQRTNSNSNQRPRKKNRETVNIAFARSLNADRLDNILQYTLIRARDASLKEASLPNAILHEIKYRLQYYYNLVGEVKRENFSEDDFDDED